LIFVHAVPRAPDVAPSLNGSVIADKIPFGQVSGALVVSADDEVSVGLQDEIQTFAARELNLRELTSYLFVMVGDPADLATLSLVMFQNTVVGRSSVRVINMSSEVPTVDVYLDDQLLAADVAYTRASERQDITTEQRLISVYPAGADRA